jgi:hypothetical protein
MKGAYTPPFTPVARVDDVLQVDDGRDREQLYRIDRVAPVPSVEIDSITVGANSVVTDVELTTLEVWDGWLGQFRPPRFSEQLQDGIEIEVDQGGRQAPMFTTREQRGVLDNSSLVNATSDPDDTVESVEDISHLAEFYVYEQEAPYFTITNTTGSQETIDLTFAGFAFELTEVQSADGQPIHVPVEALSGQ